MIVRWKWLFQPPDIGSIQCRHDTPNITQRVSSVCVGQYINFFAQPVTHRFDTRNIFGWRVTDPKLHRFVAGIRDTLGLVSQILRWLIAKRNATSIARHLLRGSPKQLVDRPPSRLTANIPKRHVNAAHADRRTSP